MTSMPADIGKIRALMKSRRYTLRQTALKMKISPALLSKVLNDERGMGPKFLLGLRLMGEDPFSYVREFTTVSTNVNAQKKEITQ